MIRLTPRQRLRHPGSAAIGGAESAVLCSLPTWVLWYGYCFGTGVDCAGDVGSIIDGGSASRSYSLLSHLECHAEPGLRLKQILVPALSVLVPHQTWSLGDPVQLSDGLVQFWLHAPHDQPKLLE